ncbi:dsDNA nuclease domain-containing protein [Amycolatopsis arida]|uniref:dsDNA nuclease domain-containing protein n=1 Tax=Amycolatopsis arida TaxID=587909 RepID=UPI001417016A|nr:dsDNA nuclease domain-containing protein [Amycolatopsis arida]
MPSDGLDRAAPEGGGALTRLPVEDAGSRTGQNYEFQYHVAARHCCALLGRDEPGWVLCEWHTDYVLGSGRHAQVLVSVKHREPQRRGWTVPKLCGDEGKLPSLRARWESCGHPNECRFVTNAPLDENAAALARACRERDRVALAEFADAAARRFGCSAQELTEFLTIVRFEHELPGRRDIRAANVERHMRPALERLGAGDVDPWKAYDLVVDEVRAASQDKNTRHPETWLLSSPGALDGDALRSTAMARRTVDAERLRVALQPLTTDPAPGTADRLQPNWRNGGPWHAPLPATAVERRELSGELVRLLVENPGGVVSVVAVHGAGGFGKTTLVHQACGQTRVKDAFSALLWMTLGEDVRGAELAAHVNDLAEQLTGRRPGWSDPQRAGMHLAEIVNEYPGPVLLVVDDVWHRGQLAPFATQPGNCTILVTTRNRWLLPAETATLLIDRMRREEAKALLTRTVPHVPERDVADLLALTGRWPVLLAIVDGTLGQLTRYGMTSAQAAQHLLDRLRTDGPAALDVSDPGSREEAIAATVEAGLALLPPDALERYSELAVFAEDSEIPIDTVALLWSATGGLTRVRVDSLCAELADASLIGSLSFSAGTFRVHDVLRAYLLHRLGAEKTKALHATLLTVVQAELGGTAETGRRPWWKLPQSRGYLADHVARHLHDAGLDDELRDLLHDLRWAEWRICEHGAAAIVADLAFLDDPAANALSRVVQQSVHLLADVHPPGSLGAVLASRLDGIAELAEHVARFGTTVPRPKLTNRLRPPDLPSPALIRTLPGNVGGSAGVAVSPDGRALASADITGTIRVWDTGSGELIHTIASELDVYTVRYTPDGHLLAGAHHSKIDFARLALFDGQSGVLRHCWTDVLDAWDLWPVAAIAPDGSWIAAAVSPNGSARFDVHVLDTSTGAVRMKIEEVGWPRTLEVSPDGAWVATGDWCEEPDVVSAACMWDATTGDLLHELDGHAGGVVSMHFAGPGNVLCTVDRQGTARIWSPAGELVRTVTGLGNLSTVAIAPDGSWLSSSSLSYEGVRIWDLDSGELRLELPVKEKWVWSAISPDGSWLVTCEPESKATGTPTTVQIWDAVTGELRQSMHGLIDCISDLAIAPDGTWVAGVDGHRGENVHDHRLVRIWSVRDKHAVPPSADPEIGQALCATPDGTRLVYGSPTGGVVLAHASFTPERLFGDEIATAVAISPDGAQVAVSDGERIKLWNVDSGEPARELDNRIGPVSWIVFAPDGSWVLTRHAPPDDELFQGPPVAPAQICDATTGRPRHLVRGDHYGVGQAVFAPDGSWLAVSDGARIRDEERSLFLIRSESGALLRVLGGHREGVGKVLVSHDGTWLLSADAPMERGTAGNVYLWDTATGRLTSVLEGHVGGVEAAAIAEDGSWFATGDRAGAVKIWCPGAATPLRTLPGSEEVTDIALSPCLRWLAVCTVTGSSGRLRIWDPHTGTALASMSVDGRLHSCHWLAGSRTICAAGVRGCYAFDWFN